MEEYIGECINCKRSIYRDKTDKSKGTYFYHKFRHYQGIAHLTLDSYCNNFWHKDDVATLATSDVIKILRGEKCD